MTEQKSQLPTQLVTLPVLPIKNSVLFPNIMMPFAVGRPASVAAVDSALATEDKTLLVFTQKDASVEEPSQDDLFEYGTSAVINKVERSGDGLHLIVQGMERVKLVEADTSGPYLVMRSQAAPVPSLFVACELFVFMRELGILPHIQVGRLLPGSKTRHPPTDSSAWSALKRLHTG